MLKAQFCNDLSEKTRKNKSGVNVSEANRTSFTDGQV